MGLHSKSMYSIEELLSNNLLFVRKLCFIQLCLNFVLKGPTFMLSLSPQNVDGFPLPKGASIQVLLWERIITIFSSTQLKFYWQIKLYLINTVKRFKTNANYYNFLSHTEKNLPPLWTQTFIFLIIFSWLAFSMIWGVNELNATLTLNFLISVVIMGSEYIIFTVLPHLGNYLNGTSLAVQRSSNIFVQRITYLLIIILGWCFTHLISGILSYMMISKYFLNTIL